MKLKKANTLVLNLVIGDVDASLGSKRYPIPKNVVADIISDNELLEEITGQLTWENVIVEASEGKLPNFSASVVDDHLEVNFDTEITDDEVDDLVFSLNQLLDGSEVGEPAIYLDCEINESPVDFCIWGISLIPEM